MPGAETFLQSVNSAKQAPKPVYGVIGEEDFLRREVLEALIEYVRRVRGQPDVVRFEGDTAELAEVLDELRSRSLFGGTRVVVLTDLGERRSLLESQRDRLAEYAHAPARDAVFVIEAAKLNKNLRLSKAIAATGERIECEPLGPKPLARWLSGHAKKQRLEMTPEAVEFMVDTVGNNLGMLAAELEKLDLYLGPPEQGKKRRVARNDLEELLGFRGAADAWALVDAISAGDMRRSLEETERLLRNGEPAYKLIGLLTFKLRQLWRGAGAVAEGANSSGAAAAAKVPPFQQSTFAAALKRYDLPACRAMLYELSKADRKDAILEVEQALEFLVITLCNDQAARRHA